MSKTVQDPGYDRVRELSLRLTEQEQVQRTGSTHPSFGYQEKVQIPSGEKIIQNEDFVG